VARRFGFAHAEAPPPAKKKNHGIKAPRKTSTRQAPCYTSVRGRRRGSTKAMPDRVLLNIEVGGSDKLPLMIRQSFKDGRYSPSIGME
jgi:hypothetical protein